MICAVTFTAEELRTLSPSPEEVEKLVAEGDITRQMADNYLSEREETPVVHTRLDYLINRGATRTEALEMVARKEITLSLYKRFEDWLKSMERYQREREWRERNNRTLVRMQHLREKIAREESAN
jgi:hypothetical protein